ncbi:DUF397 domain-containing protein [Streptomyces hainanensis]|uniref:DUF397 domain-containing protein n=1 Tax=Streptomyces hainanensis TaxID=402648 RepID=A0A4R4THC1_9ACTN|nr:DUF397 domain-containing protein [Streptomyces hainanensis]TDC77071.1 DUF397 domain-containing protein [Streptomyces hainanensis]
MRSTGVDLNTAAWRKSSYSDGGMDNCVEVADGYAGALPVRDSKQPAGPTLVFPAHGWNHFITQLQDGRL